MLRAAIGFWRSSVGSPTFSGRVARARWWPPLYQSSGSGHPELVL